MFQNGSLQIYVFSLPVLAGGPGNIQELRTSRPFYQAHQEAHALLENICLPPFHHSYQVKIFEFILPRAFICFSSSIL